MEPAGLLAENLSSLDSYQEILLFWNPSPECEWSLTEVIPDQQNPRFSEGHREKRHQRIRQSMSIFQTLPPPDYSRIATAWMDEWMASGFWMTDTILLQTMMIKHSFPNEFMMGQRCVNVCLITIRPIKRQCNVRPFPVPIRPVPTLSLALDCYCVQLSIAVTTTTQLTSIHPHWRCYLIIYGPIRTIPRQ